MSRNTKLLVALAVFAVATISSSTPGHGREATVANAPTTSTRARIDSVLLPRAADNQTVAASDAELSAQLYAMTHTIFEAED